MVSLVLSLALKLLSLCLSRILIAWRSHVLGLVLDLCLSPALCFVGCVEWRLFLSFASSLVLNLLRILLRNQEVN